MASFPHQALIPLSAAITWLSHRYAPQLILKDSLLLTFATLYLVSLFLRLSWTVVIYPKLFSPLRKLPQPPGGSFINGHFWRILNEPSGHPHREWAQNVPNKGLIYYTSLLNNPRVFVTSPDGLREVLSSKSYEFVKPGMLIKGIGRILGHGILFAEGDEHRRQRKLLMPAFSFRHIKNLYPVFWDKTRDLIEALDKEIARPKEGEKPSNVIEVQRWASRSTLDIIGVAGMDKSFNALDDENSELYQIYQQIFKPSRSAQVMQFLGILLPFWLVSNIPTKRNSMITDSSAALRKICFDMVHEKRQKMVEGKNSSVDILSIAIESGGFSDEDLVNQMMTFLAAGHETTATSLTWSMQLLCKHPEVQTRLRKELREANLPNIRDPNATVSPEILDRIPYLNAVCNEVLRFMPPVPFTLRQAARDEHILGQFIPEGTTVVMSPYAVNLSPQLWGDDAHEFNPDRWMGPGKANTGGAESNYSFLTFLHGPRSCIGQGFSKAEYACLLAGWIQAFEVELEDPDKETEIQGGLTQRPKGGVPVYLKPVEP